MNRREFLSISTAALLTPRIGAAADKPNILFILADDLAYGDLGCYGQKRILTPNLDRLAAEGVRFTQGYSGSTVCAPSRCCLMTGMHTGHATIRGNKKPEVGIQPNETTVANLLKRAGYRTAMFGKWGLGGPGTGSVPNARGFDSFFGYLDQQHAHNSYPEHLWENQNEFLLTANWFDQRKEFAPDLFTARTLEFLKTPADRPFFLCLTTTIPHADNELARLRGNGMEVPSDQPYSDRDWPQIEKNFAAMITRMDSDVGRVLEQLKASGLERNTIVIFASDNGPHKEGGHDPEYFNSRGPLRGIKRDLYEGGVRVPFIVRWPGRIAPGRVSNQVVAFWDFLPTAAELAEVETPAGLDGISFVPVLLGKPQRSHEHLYWEFHEGGFKQAVRMGDWKGVRIDVGRKIELYSLKEDLAEKNDVAAQHPDIVAKVEALMKSARTDSREYPITPGKPQP
jgi:arylsulfatase A-like enzyme